MRAAAGDTGHDSRPRFTALSAASSVAASAAPSPAPAAALAAETRFGNCSAITSASMCTAFLRATDASLPEIHSENSTGQAS